MVLEGNVPAQCYCTRGPKGCLEFYVMGTTQVAPLLQQAPPWRGTR
jgi:hypothetical protein